MGINGVSNQNYNTTQTSSSSSKVKTEDTKAASAGTTADDAVAYSSSASGTDGSKSTDSTKKTYTRDADTINKLLKDADQRAQQMRDLVERTLGKQGQTFQISKSSIDDIINSGKLTSEDIEQAKADVAEDGYWGVKQTSERLFSFAQALSGGDSSKADALMSAIEKGFKQATKDWGDELPDISKKTLDAVKTLMNDWKNSTKTNQTSTSTTAQTVAAADTTDAITK